MLNPCRLERWLFSFLFQRTAAVVSLNFCHIHCTPIVTWFHGRNTVPKHPHKLLKLLLRVLQHNPLTRCPTACPICSTHSHFCQIFAEHTASVCCLCTELESVCRLRDSLATLLLDIFRHFLLADQFYTSQMARWRVAGAFCSLSKPLKLPTYTHTQHTNQGWNSFFLCCYNTVWHDGVMSIISIFLNLFNLTILVISAPNRST